MKRIMIEAAFSAGKILVNHFGKLIEYEQKDEEKGFVSKIDKEAENTILSLLLGKYKYSVITEESENIDNNSKYCWVIDPLDGTTNYLRGIPFFCVSIALLYDKEIKAAVIYQPLSKELFFAEQGKGATLNEKLLLNKEETPAASILDCNLGYSSEAVEKYLKALNTILPDNRNIRNFGSSALELAYLAAGRLDSFLTYGDELYDVAAGILIAKEAGYKISRWNGEPWNIESPDLLVAPSFLHKNLLNNLKEISSEI